MAWFFLKKWYDLQEYFQSGNSTLTKHLPPVAERTDSSDATEGIFTNV